MQEKEKRRNSQDIKFLLRARSGPKSGWKINKILDLINIKTSSLVVVDKE